MIAPDYECENCIGMMEHGCYCKAVGAVGPGGPIAPDASARIVPCEHCGSEGRLYTTKSGHPNDPDSVDLGPCSACEGTGGEIVETEPVTLDDLAAVTAGNGTHSPHSPDSQRGGGE